MSGQASELRYAVRSHVVLKYAGQLCLVLASLTLVPLAASLIFGETHLSLRYAIVLVVLAALGAGLARLRAPAEMRRNEGMALVALMFIFTPLVMTYPMMGSGLSFMDAVFEAVSGVTTTGLSTRATLTGAPDTFLFARAWMQWYGGLGIVVFSIALLMQPGLVAKGMAVTESEADDLVGGTRAHAQRVLKVYASLTVIGLVVSLLLGLGFFNSVLYTLSAVSTGGFAPYDESISGFSAPAQAWITLMGLAGAIPLVFYHQIWRRARKEERRASVGFLQLKSILICTLAVTLALAAFMRLNNAPWDLIARHAPLAAFSAQTTTGFASMSLAELDNGSKLVMVFSMLTGGGVGSTAGGFKLLRLLIAVGVLRLVLLRTCLPRHAVAEPRIGGRILKQEEINEALLLILLFAAVVALSWLPFLAMGYDPVDSLFEVASATGTVGLSAGVTSASLPAALKGVLCFDMLMGRLEIMAWLVMLYPGTWFGKRMEVT